MIPYTIRHTMATELRKRGVPPWEVSGMLGHRSEHKTTEIYAHYAPDYLGDGGVQSMSTSVNSDRTSTVAFGWSSGNSVLVAC